MNTLTILVICFAQTLSVSTKFDYDKLTVDNFRKHPDFQQKIGSEIDYYLANACLYYAINEARKKNGVQVVPHLINIEAAAWHHAKAMTEYHFYDHYNNIDKSREKPDQRFHKAGISNPYAAECIYEGNYNNSSYLSMADDLVRGWMGSKWHKYILLDKKNQQMGCGIYSNSSSYEVKAVACFQQFVSTIVDTSLIADTMP